MEEKCCEPKDKCSCGPNCNCNCNCKCNTGRRYYNSNASGGAVYGLGFIGAAVYFISHAATFWMGVLGFIKAMVWPAFLVYEALKALAVN
jgi:hypothetical protein